MPHLEHGQGSPHAEADRPVRVVERGGLDGAGLSRLQRRLARHLEGDDVAAPVEGKGDFTFNDFISVAIISE